MEADYKDIIDNPDEEQVERQWRILQAIRRSIGVTKQELVWERKVSERTIERDIQTLSRMGFPIVDEIDNREKRYHFMQHYEFPSISLDIFEYLSLTLPRICCLFCLEHHIIVISLGPCRRLDPLSHLKASNT